jgi:hypothetical protein
MEIAIKFTAALVACAIVGPAMLAASTISVSVEVACAGPVCWHVKERHVYPPDARVVIHEDSWRGRPEEKYEWREHEGRGYWRDNKWVEW